MNIKPLAVSILCSHLLAACGGGGGGGTSPSVTGPAAVVTVPGPSAPATPPGPTISVDAAITNLYAAPHNFDRTETDPATGNVFFAMADFAVGPDTTVEGVNAKSANVKRALSKNGVLIQKSSEISFYQAAPYKLIAIQSLDSSLYQVVSGQLPLPLEGKAGQSGPFYNATVYDSADKKTVLSTSIYKWEILADTATTLTFCINSTTSFPNLPGTATNADCYKVSAVGGASPSAVAGVLFVAQK